MSSSELNTFQINREFERMVFEAVPDHPEPNFGRDTSGQVPGRYTGKSHINKIRRKKGYKRLGKYVIDPITGRDQRIE